MKPLNLPEEHTFTGPSSLWKRILAFLADIFIIGTVILLPFRKIFEGMLPKNLSFAETFRHINSNYSGGLIAVYFAVSALMFLYFYLMEKNMAQTIGKKLFNIYVVSDNESLKTWQAVVRNLFFVPIFPFDLLIFVDPIVMIFTKTNQRLSEILSRTRVVEKYGLSE